MEQVMSKTLRVFIALALVVVFIPVELNAQMEAASTTGTIGAPIAREDLKNPLPKQGNVTVNFKDVDLKTVLHYLSEVSGVDIVPAPGVDASVTMRLRDKPWETALDIVTRNYGYVHFKEGDIIRVITKSLLEDEEPKIEVIPLAYITLGGGGGAGIGLRGYMDIQALLNAIGSILVYGEGIKYDVKFDGKAGKYEILASSGESVTFLPSPSVVVVKAAPSRINMIKDMISKVDKKTPPNYARG